MKRKIALAMVLAMTASMAQPVLAADSKTTLDVIISQYGTQTQTWWTQFEKDFEAENPDIDLNVEIVSWNDLYTKVNTLVANNNAPDILNIDVLADYVADDLLMPATEYASEDLQAKFFPAFWEASTIDDTVYALPILASCRALFYNKDILDEAGYTIDDLTDITWSKFMEIGKDVHEKTGKYLLTSEATGGDTLMMMMQSCGANFVNEDGEAYIVGNEVAEKCINLYVDLVKNDVVKLVNNWDEYIATITGGEAAGIVNGNWITATLMSTEDQKGLWQITTMPKVDDVDTATNYANNGGSSWYVTSNCQNVELAEDFLASTFGSSTDFYDAILPEAGAISCYLPAGESKVYNEPNEFFGGQPIFSTIVEYSSHIPEFTKTPYHYEARECVNTAVVNIVNGTPVEDALQEAQDTLAFKMTE